DRVADDGDAHGVEQAVGDAAHRDVLGTLGVLSTLDDVDLTGVRVLDPAAGADVSGGGDDEVAVLGEVERGDVRLEALGAQVDELVVRVDVEEAQPVTGGVGRPLAELHTRGGDADDIRLGREHASGDEVEVGGARR